MKGNKGKQIKELWLVVVRVGSNRALDVRPYQQPVTLATAQAEVAAHAEFVTKMDPGGDAMGYLMERQLTNDELTAAFQADGLAEHPETRAVIHRNAGAEAADGA